MRLSFLPALAFLSCGVLTPVQAQLLTGYNDPHALNPNEVFQDVASEGPVELFTLNDTAFDASRVAEPFFSSDEATPVFRPLLTQLSGARPSEEKGEDAPVDIQADQLSRDDGQDIVHASGDVLIVQDNRILRADDVRYNLANDTATATGNVVLNEENGDIHLANEAIYNNRLRDGTVQGLRTVLADGSRLTAESGERQNGGLRTVMHNASYTPCKICANSEKERAPLWGLSAAKVTHDEELRRVSYRHARFNALGVPIAYTPYFSHPDGSVLQKSGFLSPSFGFNSDLGAFIESAYYWGGSPRQDLTIGVRAFTGETPLGLLEYRKHWDNGYFEIAGSVTSSERTERRNDIVTTKDDELRGHVFGEGRWDLNDKWRAGVDIEYASDDQFLREYDFSSEDVLENQLFLERFSGRNYASAALLAFQDVRIREIPLDQPNVLPEIIASFRGDPGAVPLVKGQWSADASLVGLVRDEDEQDQHRASIEGGWSRSLVSDYGLLTSLDATVRGDVFLTNDRTVATAGSGISTSSTETRFFPQAHIQSSYPLAKSYEKLQAKIEPVVALTFAPNLDDQDSISNEDSNDSQIDSSNLFEPSRFPGGDRVEDQSRVTYGLRSGLFGNDGSYADVFVGQSFRFDNEDNPFPTGSGLENRQSDIVGQITGRFQDVYDLNYRFQLNGQELTSERHEVDASADWDVFRVQARYLFAGALGGTDIDESREQFDASAQYYFAPEWRARVSARQDLGADPGLRNASLGIDYFGQCLFWSLTAQRNLTSEESGDSSTEILFRIGLKNLGEFQETSLRRANKSSGCKS